MYFILSNFLKLNIEFILLVKLYFFVVKNVLREVTIYSKKQEENSMKYSFFAYTSLIALLSLILGCSNSGTDVPKDKVIVGDKPTKIVTLTGTEASNTMIEVLESAADKSSSAYEITSGGKLVNTTKKQMLRELKNSSEKYESADEIQGIDSDRSLQSSCTCQSAITFMGDPPPSSREVQFHTQSELTTLGGPDNIEHTQNYTIRVADGGYIVTTGSFNPPGGSFVYDLYSRSDIYMSGEKVKAILESKHKFAIHDLTQTSGAVQEG